MTTTHDAMDVRSGLARLRPELFARALRFTRCRARAEDVVQEAMLRALRFEAQFRSGTNLRAWAMQILTSVFLSECRRQKRERRALDRLARDPSSWTQIAVPVPARTLSVPARRALDSLPPSYRLAVDLVDLQELSYRDAAVRLGVPIGTVMSRLHRGRRLLARALGEEALVATRSARETGAPLAA